MAFLNYNVGDDSDSIEMSDPVIKKMGRTAAAAVLQDIALNTYWANTVGKTKYPGVYHLYKRELKDNMMSLLSTKMSYRELEDMLVTIGYETPDIRCTFKEITCMDPAKLEFMRLEDVKNTPGNIPWFNMGWGASKKKGVESYFVMPLHSGLISIFAQVNDQERKEVGHFLRLDEALEALGGYVKSVHRYDVSAQEMVEQADELDLNEPDSFAYRAAANRFYDLEHKGALATEYVYATVRDGVTSGSLTELEGQTLLKKYAAPKDEAPAMSNEDAETDEDKDEESHKEVKKQQTKKNVSDEMRKRTPQEFFQANLPDNIEDIATEHVKSVLTYIANRESDMEGYDISLHSLQYMKHEKQNVVGPKTPESDQISGAPLATISVILEIKSSSAPSEKSKKFALAVFFVGGDGNVTTSDSIKGEDDIIYGFTEEGLQQYFSRVKNREE